MPDAHRHAPGIAVGDALRRLPLDTPGSSALPALLGQVRRARRQRFGVWLAAAASLAALALALPALRDSATPDSAPLARGDIERELQQASSRLEAELQPRREAAVASAGDVMLDLALEERLGLIDAELSRDALTPVRRIELLRLRVALLQAFVQLDDARRHVANPSTPDAAPAVARF